MSVAAAPMNARTRLLLHGPVVRTVIMLAWPTMLVQVAQAATGLIETFWVAKLGTDALAGMALVFPAVMLMQMISAGAMGGGISSAIARALGAGKRDEADGLVLHALVANVAIGAVFAVLVLVFGRGLYALLGGHGASLAAALTYSNIVFAGSLLIWLVNALASVLRGTGNMLVPSIVICGGVVLLVPLSPCLIFGIGPFPALGIAGGAVALLVYYVAGLAVLGWYVLAGRSIVRLRWVKLRWDAFYAILKVGAVASLVSLQTNVTIALTTGLVGAAAGASAIAGFRHRCAARISAHSARVRYRRAARRDGRHQHRRRRSHPRDARCVDRCGDHRHTYRSDRRVCGDLAARVALALRQRSRDAGVGCGVSARRRAVLRFLRSRHGALFSHRKARAV